MLCVREGGPQANLDSGYPIAAYGREVPDTPVEITVAEFAETIVMYEEMSAPEVGRDDFQSGEIQRI